MIRNPVDYSIFLQPVTRDLRSDSVQGFVEGRDVQGVAVAALGVHDAPVHQDRQRAVLPIQQLLGEEEPPGVCRRRESAPAVQRHAEVAGGTDLTLDPVTMATIDMEDK